MQFTAENAESAEKAGELCMRGRYIRIGFVLHNHPPLGFRVSGFVFPTEGRAIGFVFQKPPKRDIFVNHCNIISCIQIAFHKIGFVFSDSPQRSRGTLRKIIVFVFL